MGDYISDSEKFNKLIAQLREHKRNYEKKNKDKENELNSKVAELERLRERKKMLQAKVENQSVSAADVERMSQERHRLKDELKSQEPQKQAMLDDMQKFEGQSATITSETETVVTKYCDEIAALGLLG